MATLDNGFLKLKKKIGASDNRNAKLLMVIVAASHTNEIDVEGSLFLMFSTWGGEGRKGTFS